MATGTLLTVEEFVPLLESRDIWYELVEGVSRRCVAGPRDEAPTKSLEELLNA